MSYSGVTRTGFGNKILPQTPALGFVDLWRNGTRGPAVVNYASGVNSPLGVDGAWFFKKLGYTGGASATRSGSGRRRRVGGSSRRWKAKAKKSGWKL